MNLRPPLVEIREAHEAGPEQVPAGDLMGAWLDFFQANEATLSPGGDWVTVPGWGQMRRVR